MQQSSGAGRQEPSNSPEQCAIDAPGRTPRRRRRITSGRPPTARKTTNFGSTRSRDCPEDYQRAKDAGFSAPRQELFVAPDVDAGPRKPDAEMVRRGGRRRPHAHGARRGPGRPLLTATASAAARGRRGARQGRYTSGWHPLWPADPRRHHSERRARKMQRIGDGIRKAVKLWDTSEY